MTGATAPAPCAARSRPAVRVSRAVVALAAGMAVLALAASLAGLFWPGGAGPSTYVTPRGDEVQLYGRGVYAFDSVFTGANNRAMDVVVLVLGVPLLAASTIGYRRRSAGAGLVLTGVAAYFLYAYASMSLITAFNWLFLVYVALFSAALFMLILLFAAIDLRALPADVLDRLPHRGPVALMLASGAVTAVVWLSPIFQALAEGGVPARTEGYATAVTYALDLAVIVPATLLGGVLVLRRAAVGYQITFALLGIVIFLGPSIVLATWFQSRAGLEFTAAEAAGPIAGFLVVALAALWVLASVLRGLRHGTGPSPSSRRSAGRSGTAAARAAMSPPAP